jgi:hypothetical protein
MQIHAAGPSPSGPPSGPSSHSTAGRLRCRRRRLLYSYDTDVSVELAANQACFGRARSFGIGRRRPECVRGGWAVCQPQVAASVRHGVPERVGGATQPPGMRRGRPRRSAQRSIAECAARFRYAWLSFLIRSEKLRAPPCSGRKLSCARPPRRPRNKPARPARSGGKSHIPATPATQVCLGSGGGRPAAVPCGASAHTPGNRRGWARRRRSCVPCLSRRAGTSW